MHYSVACFDCITAFRVQYLRTSVKGGAHTFYIEVSHIEAPTHAYGSLMYHNKGWSLDKGSIQLIVSSLPLDRWRLTHSDHN